MAQRSALIAFFRRELGELLAVQRSDRPWGLPAAIAVATGLPMLLGAWLGELPMAALASIGAMTIAYLPRTPLDHRMRSLLAIGTGMIACHAVGQASHMFPLLRVPAIAVVAVLVTFACRYFRVVPPGALFPVMAAAIGAYAPGSVADMPLRLSVFALGALGAVLIGGLYSVHALRSRPPAPVPPPPEDLRRVIGDSLVIGAFVGLSLAVAEAFALEKPYWVPVSCLAVIQGTSLRAVWSRQAHRIVGTALGLCVTWGLIRYATGPWAIAVAVTVLTFCIEAAIVRHYAFAAIFITPMTILLAEATMPGQSDAATLMAARLLDTVIGAVIGFAGGATVHSTHVQAWFAQWPRRP